MLRIYDEKIIFSSAIFFKEGLSLNKEDRKEVLRLAINTDGNTKNIAISNGIAFYKGTNKKVNMKMFTGLEKISFDALYNAGYMCRQKHGKIKFWKFGEEYVASNEETVAFATLLDKMADAIWKENGDVTIETPWLYPIELAQLMKEGGLH